MKVFEVSVQGKETAGADVSERPEPLQTIPISSPELVLEVARQEYVHGFERSAKLDNKISITMVACTLIFPLIGDLILRIPDASQLVVPNAQALSPSELQKALLSLQQRLVWYRRFLLLDVVLFIILVSGMTLLLMGTKVKAFEPAFLLKKDIYRYDTLTQARVLGYYYNDFSADNNKMLEKKFRIFNGLVVFIIPVIVLTLGLAYCYTRLV